MRKILFVLSVCLGWPAAAIAEPDLVAVTTERCTAKLDRARAGAVVSFVDKTTGTEFVGGAAAQGLFAVAWSRPGDTSGKLQRFTAHDAAEVEWNATEQGVSAVFHRVGGQELTVTCTASAEEGRNDIRWRLHIDGQSPVILEEVRFPILPLRVPLSGDGGQDAVVAGQTKGGVFHEPRGWGVGQGLSLPQPGSLAAQFGCYYSPAAGFVSHTCDARGYPKTLDCRRTKEGLEWTWQHRCYHPMNGPFELGYEISTATFTASNPAEPADWRDGADFYKRWAVKQPWCRTRYADRNDIPDWMKAGPSMIRFSRDWLSTPERVEGWLQDYWRKHFPDIPLIVALWGWERVGSWVSPKYFPPYPTEADFLRITAAARSVGGHPFPWPSGYYWNVEYRQKADGSFEWNDWEDFNANGLPHAVQQRDGTPLVVKLPWLEGGRNAALCRGDAWTRQWFNQAAERLMQLGCDMVQVDQVVGGLAPGRGECFSTGHGHPPGVGVWDAEAFAAQLESLALECRRVQPGAVLAIEEPQELFNHLIGIQDYRDAQSSHRSSLPGMTYASVFGYLYHEYLPVFQSNPQRGNLAELAHCAVTGQIPHWVPHWPVAPAPALANGDFEPWSEGVPLGWDRVGGWQGTDYTGRCYPDDQVKARGETSLRLENSGNDEIVQVSQNVAAGTGYLQAGHRYRLRARVKVEQLARPNAINLAALTGDLGSKGSWRIAMPSPGDWTERSAEFTMPSGAAMLRIMIHISGPCRLWVDDMTLDEEIEGHWQPLLQPGLPPEHEFLAQWVRLFHGDGRPYLLLGEMIHPPRLIDPLPTPGDRAALPSVLLNAFRAPDGSEAAVIANPTSQEHPVRFLWHGQDHTLQMPPGSLRLAR
ncbi:MAG: DUF6259 domain-containing protein [Thermoguttaceae bacterium]